MSDSYVYESPDGGLTIYKRKLGDDPAKRIQVRLDDLVREELDKQENFLEWQDILDAAKDNPVLQSAIERVKIVYHLTKDNDDAK